MDDFQERSERQERAVRLAKARTAAGYESPALIAQRFPDWNINRYKAHEAGRNDFSTAAAKTYADAFGVSVQWLMLGIGKSGDK